MNIINYFLPLALLSLLVCNQAFSQNRTIDLQEEINLCKELRSEISEIYGPWTEEGLLHKEQAINELSHLIRGMEIGVFTIEKYEQSMREVIVKISPYGISAKWNKLFRAP